MDELKEKIADAIAGAEVDYHLRLTSLVDGVSTYTLTYGEESEPLTFDDIKDGYAHIAARKRELQAQAALTAIEEAGYVVFPKEAIEKMVREYDAERTDLTSRLFTALGATFVPSSPSYFDRADSATSFDPERQFEKDSGL